MTSADTLSAINESGAITATDGTLNSSIDDTKVALTVGDAKERNVQLPPWLDIIIYWQHTKADQPISAMWGLKSSIKNQNKCYFFLTILTYFI